jgi:hypothetical protein
MSEPTAPRPQREELAPADYYDPVIEAYKKDVDRTLLRENLKLTVEERFAKAEARHRSAETWEVKCRAAMAQAQAALTELQALLDERRKLDGSA